MREIKLKEATQIAPHFLELEDLTSSHKALNHLGFIAAAIDELGIVQSINALIPSAPGQIVSAGESVAAIILNFLSRSGKERLYVTPEFFETIPVEQFFGDKIKAHHLNDDTLGRTLDRLADFGPSVVFNTTMITGATKANLISKFIHLDTTSVSFEGEYKTADLALKASNLIGSGQSSGGDGGTPTVEIIDNDEDEAANLKITYGHSKDHRSDLKQIVISLMVTGVAQLPLFMETLDGNASDRAHFAGAFENAQKVCKKRLEAKNFICVEDNALFTKNSLKQMEKQGLQWITLVPKSNLQAKALLQKEILGHEWTLCKDSNYQVYECHQQYAGIGLRWALVFSWQAFERDSKSFQDKLERERVAFERTQKALFRQTFSCKKDAEKAVKKAFSKFKYSRFQPSFVNVLHHSKVGRPAPDAQPKIIGVKVEGTFCIRQDVIDSTMKEHGKFIVATNVLDTEEISTEEILVEYKKQSSCEASFKFLKDPAFQMNRVFLKTPSRIASMMMILSLAVAVAHLIEYNLRTALVLNKDSIPNKAKKPTQKLTFALLLFHMYGVGVTTFGLKSSPIYYCLMTDLNPIQKKLVKYFGPTAEKIYCKKGWSFISSNP